MNLYFTLLVLKLVNAVVVVIMSMIHMQKCQELMKEDTENGIKYMNANVD